MAHYNCGPFNGSVWRAGPSPQLRPPAPTSVPHASPIRSGAEPWALPREGPRAPRWQPLAVSWDDRLPV